MFIPSSATGNEWFGCDCHRGAMTSIAAPAIAGAIAIVVFLPPNGAVLLQDPVHTVTGLVCAW